MVSRADTPIRYVPGIGAVRAKALEKLGITTVRELRMIRLIIVNLQ